MSETAYLYQGQAERVLRDTEKNLLVIAPTGAGKTESGFTGLEIAGKGIYVAPTRALCYEKAQWLRERFPNSRVVIGNKDYSLTLGDFHGSQVRVLTPWKLGVILHNDPNFTRYCPLVVLDEIRKLDPEVDLIITKLQQLHPEVRLVGLSATVHEDDEPKLASWMNAVVVKSEERPVPLIARLVHFNPDFTEEGEEYTCASFWEGTSDFDHRRYEGSMHWVDRIVALVEYIHQKDGAPILIYTPYRERARQLAEKLASEFGAYEGDSQKAADSLPAEAGDFTDTLKKCLPRGVGMHHDGLTAQEREMVFQLALKGKLPIVVTCQTLATGINLPARHLVVESVYCEPDGSDEKRLMAVSDFWNVAGRAGRPQFDSIGYVWIPVSTEIERAEVEEVLLKHKASKIVSRIYDEYFLTAHIAGLVQLGYSTPAKLAKFMKATYFGATLQDHQPLVDQFEKIIARLVGDGFARQMGRFLVLTDRGHRLARLGMHPAEYETIERLLESDITCYETWVIGLVDACAEYVLKRNASEEEHKQVASYGMTAHTLKTSWHVRELVDYLERLLELTFNFLEFNKVNDEFRWRYRREVADRFLFGQVEIARKLARVLPRPVVKRILRNFGTLEKVDPETGERTQIALDDTMLKMLARIIWSQHGMPSTGELGRVAGVFGITEVRFRRLVKDALEGESKEAA